MACRPWSVMANDTRVRKVVMITFRSRMRGGALKVSLSQGAQESGTIDFECCCKLPDCELFLDFDIYM